MEVPRFWRLQREMYCLQGYVCPKCETKMFPRKVVCPTCNEGLPNHGVIYQPNRVNVTEPTTILEMKEENSQSNFVLSENLGEFPSFPNK